MFYKLSFSAILLLLNLFPLLSQNYNLLDNNSSNYSINSPIIRDSVYWESLPPLPEAKIGPCVGYSYVFPGNTKLYVLGGNPPEQNDIMYIFDFSTLSWSDPIQMPCSISHAGCVNYGNNIYIIGGYPAKDEIWIYHTPTDSFSQASDLLIGVEDPIVTFNTRILVAGGYDGHNVIDTVQFYDLYYNETYITTPLPEPRMAGVAFDWPYLICLGKDSAGNYPTNTYIGQWVHTINLDYSEYMDLKIYPDSIDWQAGPDFPGLGCEYPGYGGSYINGFQIMIYDKYIYGGFNSNYLYQCYQLSQGAIWGLFLDMSYPPRYKMGSCGFPLQNSNRIEYCLAAVGGYNDSALTCFHILHTDFELLNVEETPPVISNQITCNLVSSNIIRDQFKLEFNLPYHSNVSFSVFDISGRKIYQQGNLNLPPGIHHLDWNLNDSHGEQLVRGVYFFLLETDSQVFREKFTIIR